MEDLTFSTPALFFSALSIMVLAYTSKFVTYGLLIRKLYLQYKTFPDKGTLNQIHNLKKRLYLIRGMQICGISGLFGCAITMYFLYLDIRPISTTVFGISMVMITISLLFLLIELFISTKALNLCLKDIESNVQ